MKNIAKLIIGYLLIIPAWVFWISTAFSINILQLMTGFSRGDGTDENFGIGLISLFPLLLLYIIFPLISGILGISVYKKKDRYKFWGLALSIISLVFIILAII